MDSSTPGLPVHHQLLEFTQTHVHQVSEAIRPSHPLSFPSPPAFNLSQHQDLSNESALCIRWPKFSSFSFSISLSNAHSGLISFRDGLIGSPCNHYHHFNDTDHFSLFIMANNLMTYSHALFVLVPTTILWVGGQKVVPIFK